MQADRETGCTCYDETTRKCPVHKPTTQPDPAQKHRKLAERIWVEAIPIYDQFVARNSAHDARGEVIAAIERVLEQEGK